MAEGAKHEIHCPWFVTGVTAICGPVHNSHNWYIAILMRPQVLQATPHIVWLKPGILGHKIHWLTSAFTLNLYERFWAFVVWISPRDLEELETSAFANDSSIHFAASRLEVNPQQTLVWTRGRYSRHAQQQGGCNAR